MNNLNYRTTIISKDYIELIMNTINITIKNHNKIFQLNYHLHANRIISIKKHSF